MIKKITSAFLIFVMIVSMFPVFTFAAVGKTAEAAYGTPVIDGEIDEIWDKTNYYIVENCNRTGEKRFKGWFKVLWDENYIYLLSKSYSTQLSALNYAWEQDSVDMYIDEITEGQEGYRKDDYQTRINFLSSITGNNYPDFGAIKGKSVTGETKDGNKYFISEMAVPLITKSPKENMSLGFEILMTSSDTMSVGAREYLWNTEENWLYNRTSCYGTLELKKTVENVPFYESQYIPPKGTRVFKPIKNSFEASPMKYITDVVTDFDGKTYNIPILHVKEYPQMAIDDVAEIMGAEVVNGDTLVKTVRYPNQSIDDTITIKYTAGSDLADYKDTHLSPENGYMRKVEGYPRPDASYLKDSAKQLEADRHIILDRTPTMYNGKLFIPLTSVLAPYRYSMHYDRFNKLLKFTSGENYPDTELVFNVKDYGAVGDGEANDYPAIRRAVDAAMASGKPSKVLLEPNKIYRLGANQDNISYFSFSGVENIIFDGQGSTLRTMGSTNNFVEVVNSANVKIMNLTYDREMPNNIWGTVVDKDPAGAWVDIEIPEFFPLPPTDEWEKKFVQHGFWYTMNAQPDKPAPKFGMCEYMLGIQKMDKVEGKERVYRIYGDKNQYVQETEFGDRYTIMTRNGMYDVGDSTHYGFANEGPEFFIYRSGDITIENVTIHGANNTYFNVALCWGDVNLTNFEMRPAENCIVGSNRDALYCWNNRGSLNVDGCLFTYAFDDSMNTCAPSMPVQSYNEETRTVTATGEEDDIRVGDEMMVVNANSAVNKHEFIGRAFVEAVNKIGAKLYEIKLDRHIEGIDPTIQTNGYPTTILYNAEKAAPSSVVVNNQYYYGRRYGWLSKSKNSIMANNLFVENGGSALASSDERRGQAYEGSFADWFTMSGNLIIMPEEISTVDFPVQVQWQTGRDNNEPALVDGFLIENNIIDSGYHSSAMMINSVQNLYLLNNKIISSMDIRNNADAKPILIKNSEIAKIDGIEYDFKANANAVVNITGSKYDPNDITNINDKSDNAKLDHKEF